MSLLDNVRRIQLDDITDENRKDFAVLAELYNYFAEQTTNTINGNIGIENLTRELITVDVTVNESGKPVLGGTFSASQGIGGSKVLRATNLDNPTTYPTNCPFISFTALNTAQNLYRIDNIAGIQANTKWRLFVELVPNE